MMGLEEMRERRLEKFILQLTAIERERAEKMDWEEIHQEFCGNTVRIPMRIHDIRTNCQNKKRSASLICTCKCGFKQTESHREYYLTYM